MTNNLFNTLTSSLSSFDSPPTLPTLHSLPIQHRCFDVSHLFHFIRTRLFVVENRYDSNQIYTILLTPRKHTKATDGFIR